MNKLIISLAALLLLAQPAQAMSNKAFKRFVYLPVMVLTVVLVGPICIPAVLVENERIKRNVPVL